LKQSLGFVPHPIAGVTGPLGSGNKFGEQRVRERIVWHAFRVPLHTDDPAGAALPFDGFDGAIGSMGRDGQVSSWLLDGLVMAAIDHAGWAAVELGEKTARFEGCRMLEVALFDSRR
jgi:hypothetical protein